MVKTLNAGALHYELNITRKITLVVGDSGDGKTTFIRTLGQQIRLNRERVKRVFGNPLLLSADIPEEMALMSLAQWQQFDICVLDCDSHSIGNYAELINKAAIPFILMSRDKISCVPVHYDSVVRLIKSADGVMRFEQQYHPKLGLLTDIYTVIEDSGIGFRFYEQVYQRNNCVFVSAGGYGNIASRVN